MLLVDIAAQGLRGLPSTIRVGLRPGYNVVALDGVALRRILDLLWHPDRPPDPGLVSGAAVARAGLTLVGNDRVTWRVVRDLAGGCQLLRFDPASRSFLRTEDEPSRVAARLRDEAGVPPPAQLDGWLAFAAAELPSRVSGPAARLTPLPFAMPPEVARVARPSARPAVPPPSPELLRRRTELQDELRRARDAEWGHARLEDLQGRLGRVEAQLHPGDQARERLRRAEDGVAALAVVRAAIAPLGDAAARIAEHLRATGKRDEALARLSEERRSLEEAGVAARGAPAWQGAALAGCALVAVGALAAGAASTVPTLALLALPSGSAAAWLALRRIGAAERADRRGRRATWIDERERKLRDTWERETGEVRAAVAAAGVGSAEELEVLRGRVAEGDAALADARAVLADWEAQPETMQSVAERERLRAEIASVETRLAPMGLPRDRRTVEEELSALEASLAPPAAVAPRPSPAMAPPSVVGGAPPAASHGAASDALRTLLARAAAETGQPPRAALASVQRRVAAVLGLLSGQQYSGVVMDEKGAIVVRGGGREAPVASLALVEQDACHVAVRLAFLEMALGGGRAVALLADPFAPLPEAMRRSLARQVQQVARAGQVVHSTSDAAFREAADHRA